MVSCRRSGRMESAKIYFYMTAKLNHKKGDAISFIIKGESGGPCSEAGYIGVVAKRAFVGDRLKIQVSGSVTVSWPLDEYQYLIPEEEW